MGQSEPVSASSSLRVLDVPRASGLVHEPMPTRTSTWRSTSNRPAAWPMVRRAAPCRSTLEGSAAARSPQRQEPRRAPCSSRASSGPCPPRRARSEQQIGLVETSVQHQSVDELPPFAGREPPVRETRDEGAARPASGEIRGGVDAATGPATPGRGLVGDPRHDQRRTWRGAIRSARRSSRSSPDGSPPSNERLAGEGLDPRLVVEHADLTATPRLDRRGRDAPAASSDAECRSRWPASDHERGGELGATGPWPAEARDGRIPCPAW